MGPGCAANSTGSTQPNPATSSCVAVASPVSIYAADVEATNYIAQVLSVFPQNIAVGLPATTSLGPVCVNYATQPSKLSYQY